ncbi:flagellar assembly peptidoglycan hydrolase FlgJ [Pseudothauera nasutitermitis]|uniref:Peptidoglycan hydrolase FlgJ n=1 Tax=Pseudothauera nasutitermitis TaxID=2565930 RepID=A0A4S4AZX1_9RHOO|nr:flagellar assembly peptidoglycan hydrolase FlgJ [Pseudothauera nasutitermitis]THF65721.1 flagellar assembly peptidoglycan hydrolase FlgJ [Pseudothauera nasutitermitis]
MDAGFQINALDPRSLSELQRLARDNPDSPEALRGAAKQFEALLWQMALKAMREATPKNSMFDSEHSRTYQSLLDQQMALEMAHSRNNGMSEVLFRQLGGLNGKHAAAEAMDAPATGLPIGPAPGFAVNALNQAANAAAMLAQQNGLPVDGAGVALPARAASADSSDADPIGALISQLEAARRFRGSATPAATPATGAGRAVEAGAASSSSAQEDASAIDPRAAFVREVWPHAEAASRATGIPARFIVAHAALETGWGEKVLRHADGRSSYNLFNIKAGSSWNGDSLGRAVTEYSGSTPYVEQARFRSYESYAEAFSDYARLLSDNSRYARVLGQTDAHGFARGLQQAGYATDPRYAAKLAGVITGPTLNKALTT